MAYVGDDPSNDPFGDASEHIQSDGVEIIDLTGIDEVKLEHPKQASPPINKSQRNYKLGADHRAAKQVAVNGGNYRVGDFVELRELVGAYRIQFIEIKSISAHNETDDITIRGLPYARARHLGGCLPKMCSEVCLIVEVDADDARPDEEQALLQIEPEEILQKRILTNTNKAFPGSRFDRQVYVTDEQKEHKAPLACRWKMRAEYRSAAQRRAGRPQGLALEHLSERDGDRIKKRNLAADEERARVWRGEAILGGSVSKYDSVKDEGRLGVGSSPERVQKYSFASVLAGAGGASRGAQMAGFDVVLAAEPDVHAMGSHKSNFPDVVLHCLDTTELLASGKDQHNVDVLHISPSALEEAGDDEKAVTKLCKGLLERFRPRLVLMEQPPTITSEKNTPFFNKMILSFTETGYSTHWKSLNMVDYGLPQVRKRVILVGAGPGEQLPSWPAATHSADPDPNADQKPFLTEEEAISGLNPNLHSLHEPDELPVVDRPARDADEPIPSVIGSHGSVYPHPDGEREFTLRELASLQGFPTYHEFEGAYIKKQIGTAFPPQVAMAFCQHLRQHLEEVDGVGALVEPSGTSAQAESGDADGAGGPRLPETPSASLTPEETASLPPSPPSTPPTAPLPTPPQQQLPTPSTSGSRFIAGRRAAALRLRRERAAFEASQGDGDNEEDEGGPETLGTPSKRQRTSNGSDVSRTESVSDNDDDRRGNDTAMYDDSDLDDEFPVVDEAWGSQSLGRRGGSCDGEV
ncbi:hypothetical protein KVR01_007779 [Diaporthe batatas]|uniref:uncharacterized protein n=1 Tax=Diaporthe batatas TaxID=748121 RepID=UPI001D04B5FA|nr:uncharacterized protein KVR01_007779 [Diaporthe batatas]KAG8162014.1 hypothetical protein KVR01_007779 [Diaporthe batatas]